MSEILDKDFYSGSTIDGLEFSRFGYDNVVASNTVTASSSIAGFESDALENPFTYEIWKPSTFPATITVDAGKQVSADYLGISSHELAGCYMTLEHSQDGINYTNTVSAVIVDNLDSMILFAESIGRFWRITLTGWADEPTMLADFVGQQYSSAAYDAADTGGASLSVLGLGKSLSMQREIYGGHTPAKLSEDIESTPNRSEGGQWLGLSIIRAGNSEAFSFDNLTADWYRLNFVPLVEHLKTLPCFALWRPQGYADEAIYGWSFSKISPSNAGVNNFMTVNFTLDGARGNV